MRVNGGQTPVNRGQNAVKRGPTVVNAVLCGCVVIDDVMMMSGGLVIRSGSDGSDDDVIDDVMVMSGMMSAHSGCVRSVWWSSRARNGSGQPI